MNTKFFHRQLAAATAVTISIVAGPFAVFGKGASVTPTVQPAFTENQIFKGNVSAGVKEGETALMGGDYAKATDAFRQALNQNSKDTNAMCGLGFALALQFKLDGAEQQFNKALAIDAQNPLAHVGIAFVTLNRLQSSSMTIINQRAALLTRAQSEVEQALRSDPNMPEGLLVQGLIAKAQGNTAQAKASFAKSIAAEPKYGVAFVNRGLISLDQGDTASAIADFKEAIRLRSNNGAAHYALGRALVKMGQLDAAHDELNTALSLNKNSAPAHLVMGDVYRLQGNSVAAIKEYNACIAIKPEYADAYIRLADIYNSRGDLEFAAAQLRSGLVVQPDNIDLHRRLADVLLRSDKLDDALKEYNTVLGYNPGDVSAVNGMTTALMLKSQKEASGAFFVSNNFEAAERMLQQAIKMNPNNLQLRLADCKLRALSGQTVDLSTVGVPTNDPERIAYAQACQAQFKFNDANQAMNTVIADCQNADDTFAVADMSLLIHDLDSANAAYKKAGSFPGPDNNARAQRGLGNVAAARDKAKQSLTLANDLAKRAQLASAIDNYRAAAYANPRLADAHLGLAEVLEKYGKKDSASLREANLHYKAYLTLEPNLPEKEREKISKRAAACQETAYKLDNGQSTSKISALFQPIGNIGKKVGTGLSDLGGSLKDAF